MKTLTKTQQKIFDFICYFTKKEGYPPSYSEIASQFGYSSDGTVRSHLELLEKKGYIKRHGKARGVKILKFPEKKHIPILGKIAAGTPMTAIEDFVGTLDDIHELQYKDGRIALVIKGDSMIDAGIWDGDIAIIQTGTSITNGQIGAVIVNNDDVTLKRVYFEKDQVRLKPENKHYQDLILDKHNYNTRILGKYIALIRRN